MNKDLIQNRFSKNLKTYNSNAKIQKKMAEKLLSYITNKQPQTILEIGCGTGLLTDIICKNLTFETYTAIDIVEDCENYIKKINPKINFINADIETYINKLENKFDLIISNATFQWLDDFETTTHRLQNMLSNNGEFVFSTFGNENFREIFHVIGTSLQYYSENELRRMLPLSTIESEIHILAFDSPKEVLKHLQLTGVNGVENKIWTKKDLANFENGYKNFCSRRATLTYNPIYIKIIPPVG